MRGYKIINKKTQVVEITADEFNNGVVLLPNGDHVCGVTEQMVDLSDDYAVEFFESAKPATDVEARLAQLEARLEASERELITLKRSTGVSNG